jgi:hypothetical protein
MEVSIDASQINEILNKLESPITINKKEFEIYSDPAIFKLFKDLYDIHPLSTLLELKDYYKATVGSPVVVYNSNIGDSDRFSTYIRENEKFPKNRITSEMISKVQLYEPKLFTSLESVEEALNRANEDNVLGNNANYSFIGGIGGTVTEEEVNNDTLEKKEGDSTVEFSGTESYKKLDLDIRKKKVSNIVDAWNSLFEKAILGK